MYMTINFFRVGGCLRDKFLGLESKDIDFAVEAPSFDALRDVILARGGRIFLETPETLTIRAIMPEFGAADFVLCRKDGPSTDGRHPDFVEVGTILDDLARRDFTINAIAENCETGEILDPHNGRKDIEDGIIRAVGSPDARFQEDRLRTFRALRFAITKNMRLHCEVASAIGRLTPTRFDAVSTERIREELLKMFRANTPRSFKMLQDFPVLWEIVEQRGIWFKPTTEKL